MFFLLYLCRCANNILSTDVESLNVERGGGLSAGDDGVGPGVTSLKVRKDRIGIDSVCTVRKRALVVTREDRRRRSADDVELSNDGKGSSTSVGESGRETELVVARLRDSKAAERGSSGRRIGRVLRHSGIDGRHRHSERQAGSRGSEDESRYGTSTSGHIHGERGRSSLILEGEGELGESGLCKSKVDRSIIIVMFVLTVAFSTSLVLIAALQ